MRTFCHLATTSLKGVTLRFVSDVAEARKHLARNVTGNRHDRLVARAAFRQLGDQRVPIVMPPPLHSAAIAPTGPNASGSPVAFRLPGLMVFGEAPLSSLLRWQIEYRGRQIAESPEWLGPGH
jgi:hypothetical protein